MTIVKLTEIDLSKTTRHGGDGLEVGPTYLVLYRGRFHAGTFNKQWYGLSFNGIYDAGAQYDPPGINMSSWQKIWKIENAKQISDDAEPEYQRLRREYAIANKMTSNGQTIDETAPLDAFKYVHTVDAMPKRSEDDDEY